MICLRVLSRRNLADASPRSSLNPRLFNHLQPLCLLFPTPGLCFQQLAASFPKHPGWGYPPNTPSRASLPSSHAPRNASIPMCPHSIAHTSRHHGDVPVATFRHSDLPPLLVRPLFSYSYRSLFPPARLHHSLFSVTHKSLGGQPFSFHIHTNPPGVSPSACP
jgi:hypothetical protein